MSRVFRARSRHAEPSFARGRRVRRTGARGDRRVQVSVPASNRAGSGRPTGVRHRRRSRLASLRRRHVGTHVVAPGRRSWLRPERTPGSSCGSSTRRAVSASAGTFARAGTNRTRARRTIARSGFPIASVAATCHGPRHRRRGHHRSHLRCGGTRVASRRSERGVRASGGVYARSSSSRASRLTVLTAEVGSSSTTTPWIPTSIAADTLLAASSRNAVRWAGAPSRSRANR